MRDSLFTKIIKGEIACHKVYEDTKTLAFLDIDPLLPGHVLVVPKLQVDQFDDLPDDVYQAVFATVKKVAARLKKILGAQRAIVMVLGYDVPHAHAHVIPSDTSEAFLRANADRLQNGLEKNAPNHAELAALAKKLAF